MESEKSFLGAGWAFPPTFIKESKQVQMLSDEKDINNSLEVLLSTSIGERKLQAKYGSNLSDLVFETMDTGMISFVADMVKDAILLHEPRVIPGEITLENTQTDGTININVNYTISATNSNHNLVYPFYLNQGSNNS